MLVTTMSIAATTDPLPGNNPPADAPSSAEGAGAGGAEGKGQSKEPIAVDLDIPPGLAEFLDEKYPEQSPAQRTAEKAAAAASQAANNSAQNNSIASPNIEPPGNSENAETSAPGSSGAAQSPSQASQNPSSAPIPQRLPESIQESPDEEVLSEETVSGKALESDAEISVITESPTPVNLPNLSIPDPATVAGEDSTDVPLAALPFNGCFTAAADKYQVEEALLMGVAIVESSMDPGAISSSDAIGLMQIKWPITANHLGITDRRTLFDPCTNIDAGARYLRELLDDLAGFSPEPRRRLALASYRLGPNGFDPNVPLPANAQNYIEKVTAQERLLIAPAPERTITTAGPVLPCLVQNLRGLAMTTHDPAQRSVQVGQWLDARGEGCSALALIQIRNNLPVWLGTALTPERATQVTDLLEQVINTTASADTRPSRPRPQ
ncbi:lytic transglycosylase domain-containing protein [Gammaproteobacteria bacterium]|nr:lytic transglycosylase domain-containing protein [Gammaproteobacteria bacterium]